MSKAYYTQTLFLLCLAVCMPAQAQKLSKLPQAGKAAAQASAPAAKEFGSALQQALYHAAALREIRAAKTAQGIVPVTAQTSATPPSVTALPARRRTIRRTPQQWLALLEEFIEREGRYPVAGGTLQENSIYAGIRNAQKKLAADDPLVLRVQELREKYAAPRREPQQWLEELEAFIAKEGRFPRTANAQEKPLYIAVMGTVYRLDPQDPVAVRMRELKEKYTPEPVREDIPKKRLAALEAFIERTGHYPLASQGQEERKLYDNLSALMRQLDPQDPVALRMRALQAQYPPVYAVLKTRQQRLDELEAFVQAHGRFPLSSVGKQEERSLYVSIHTLLARLDPQDPVAVRMRELKAKYQASTRVPTKTPQEWLELLEEFIAQQGRYPQAGIDNTERSLYMGVYNFLRHAAPDDPVAMRMRALQRPYDAGPKRLLERLENFVTQYDRFPVPSIDGTENKLYWDVKKLLEQLPADDPVAIRIRRLRTQQLFYP